MKRSPGRPRQFESETALDQALRLFWNQGYEGTSITDLTTAMGITAPSLYGAFGSKEELYRKTLVRYAEAYSMDTAAVLQEEPTAYAAIRRVLLASAGLFADAANPAGCMISTATLRCAPENGAISEAARARRLAALDLFAKRIQAGITAGELPSTIDAWALAQFFGAVIQGMSIQAIDGASEEELTKIAETALLAWPK